MKHISEIIEEILVEWAYRVHDGMPNPKNAQHIQELRESMEELNLPNKVIYEVIQNLINEDGGLDDKEKEKAKKMGLVHHGKGAYGKEGGEVTHQAVDGKLVVKGDGKEPEKETKPPMKIDANPFDDKEKETGDHLKQMDAPDDYEDSMDDLFGQMDDEESSGKEYLTDLGIEVPEGLSAEEIESIAKTEKERIDFVSKTIDLLISQATQQRKGKGTNDLTQDEWKKLKDFTEGKGPKNPTYDINDDDIDNAIKKIKSIEGGGRIVTAMGNKGSAGKGDQLTTKKWIKNPNYDSTKPAGKRGDPPENNPKQLPGLGLGRERKVLKSFLMTGGLSVVTGKPLSIGASELDHRLSLDNGGKDEASNWVWMESRFNQQKNKLSDEKLIERANKWLNMDPEKLKADKKKKLITNETIAFAKKHWENVFKKGGNGGINEEMLNSLTIQDLKNIANGWSAYNTGDTINYYHAGDGNRTRGVYVGKEEHVKRILKVVSKYTQVLTKEEIEESNKVLQNAVDEIKTRERDIKV